MDFVRALDTSAVPPGAMKAVEVRGTMVLIANIQGTYYALPNRCPHLGGSLADGTLDGKVVTCPRHGSQYDVTTGENLRGAKIAFLKIPVRNARPLPVKLEDTNILVGIE